MVAGNMNDIASLPVQPDAATHSASKMAARDVNLWYGAKQALFGVSLEIA